MGLMDRIFHRAKVDTLTGWGVALGSGEKAFTHAVKIVQDYGAVMRWKRSAAQGCIADVQGLPHPKERIKQALALLLGASDDPQFREQLKSSYLLLADWQEGVGHEMVGLRPETDANGRAAEDREAPASQSAAWEEWERWRPKVLQEERALKAELQQLGLW
ncbi:hypothetical protein SBBP1_400006 [Burkholderiales bacterium]|nr:hypothetical protein SBBP1_400006 [Burkholderiales bacterium]